MVAQHGGVEELGVSAVGAVPGMATVGPGQVEGERGEEVVERPGDDDVVIEADVQSDEDDSVANSWWWQRGQAGAFPGHPRASSPGELAPTATTQPLCLSFFIADCQSPLDSLLLTHGQARCARVVTLPRAAGSGIAAEASQLPGPWAG